MTDSLVIGAGVIGCATALALAQNGVKVTLLDRGALGAEASWAGAGLLFPLLPWEYKPPVWALTAYSLDLYPAWISAIRDSSEIDPEFIESGLAVLQPYGADLASEWSRLHRVWMVESDQVIDGVKALGRHLDFTNVHQIRNPRLMRAMQAALKSAGVKVAEHVEVTGFEREQDKILRVKTAQRDYRPGSVVVAAGAWTQPLIASLGMQSDMVPVRGQIELFKSEPGKLTRLLYRDGIYVVPRADGHILVGSTMDYAGFDKTTTEKTRNSLIAAALSLVEGLRPEHHVKSWAGLRPGSSNNIPVIARHPAFENLYLNTGHFRYGVTMAPASARLLADILLGRQSEIDRAAYARPDYFEPTPASAVAVIRQSPEH